MVQASLLGWVEPKKKSKRSREPPVFAYRFLKDFPEGIMLPGGRSSGPIRAGDLLSHNALPKEVWRVLLMHGYVEPYLIRPEWPGGVARG